MDSETKADLLELRAEVEVLRAYVQALLGFVPMTPLATGFVGNTERALNAAVQNADPERAEALKKAMGNLSALRQVGRAPR